MPIATNILEGMEGGDSAVLAGFVRAAGVAHEVQVHDAGNAEGIHALLHVHVLAPAMPPQVLAHGLPAVVLSDGRQGVDLDGAEDLHLPLEVAVQDVVRRSRVPRHVLPHPVRQHDRVGVRLQDPAVLPDHVALHEHVPSIDEGPRVQPRVRGHPVLVVKVAHRNGAQRGVEPGVDILAAIVLPQRELLHAYDRVVVAGEYAHPLRKLARDEANLRARGHDREAEQRRRCRGLLRDAWRGSWGGRGGRS
mmetsp:Transcript_88634/g.275550  ORF Transcript_88634/g.275550 Transcript_88634/m.275550 type:complete len:249 (-) Transcript_88634:514-1260(-)